jgi:hypothetical protein
VTKASPEPAPSRQTGMGVPRHPLSHPEMQTCLRNRRLAYVTSIVNMIPWPEEPHQMVSTFEAPLRVLQHPLAHTARWTEMMVEDRRKSCTRVDLRTHNFVWT